MDVNRGGGSPRLRVSDVLSLLAAGADETEILEDYPYPTAEDITECLTYAAAKGRSPAPVSRLRGGDRRGR